MTSSNKSFNPSHALLVVVSVVFALTACAYGVMAIHRIDPTRSVETPPHDAPVTDALNASGPVLPDDESTGLRDSPGNAETLPSRLARGQWLLEQLDRYGAALLMIELAVLAVIALAAMRMDRETSA